MHIWFHEKLYIILRKKNSYKIIYNMIDFVKITLNDFHKIKFKRNIQICKIVLNMLVLFLKYI